jgi:hypothetical protein
MKSKEQSFWKRKKGWILSCSISFICFFGIGASLGWWLIDKDAGKYRASFSEEQPLSDYLYPMLITGLAFGMVGASLGLGSYSLYRFVRKKNSR